MVAQAGGLPRAAIGASYSLSCLGQGLVGERSGMALMLASDGRGVPGAAMAALIRFIRE
jgi:hypothetical protein